MMRDFKVLEAITKANTSSQWVDIQKSMQFRKAAMFAFESNHATTHILIIFALFFTF